jgi:hypothetical protein
MSKTKDIQQFSYESYYTMLLTAIEKGYKISSFKNYDAKTLKTIILRHDVDYTCDGMLRFAEIEHKLGCTATYLFRVHADEYNLFSCSTWSMIDRIRSLGHEIGLHFEAMNVGRALRFSPPELLKREKDVIEAVIGSEIATCSEHREISGGIHNTPLYHEIYDPYEHGFEFYAMDPKYCDAMKYLSDSNANWREGDLSAHLDKHDRFQVLVHPDWWFESDLLLKGPYHHPRSTHI